MDAQLLQSSESAISIRFSGRMAGAVGPGWRAGGNIEKLAAHAVRFVLRAWDKGDG